MSSYDLNSAPGGDKTLAYDITYLFYSTKKNINSTKNGLTSPYYTTAAVQYNMQLANYLKWPWKKCVREIQFYDIIHALRNLNQQTKSKAHNHSGFRRLTTEKIRFSIERHFKCCAAFLPHLFCPACFFYVLFPVVI